MISNRRWPTRLLAALLLGLLPIVAWALTVTGRVNEAGDTYVVVGGTHFMTDEQTEVVYAAHPDSGRHAYRPGLLTDVYRARVSGVNRKADEIVILPFGYEFGEN